jgi:lipopolysaccharide/colanic/teichoic acid biosynthesis glycosyltransferase
MQNQSANIYRLLTIITDVALILGLFALVGWWRFEDLRISNPEYYNYYLQLWVLTGVSWIAVGRWSGSFTYTAGLEQRNVTAQLLQAALAQFAILAIIVVGLKGYYYSRLFLVAFFAAFYTLAWISRLLFVNYLRRQMAAGKWQRKFYLVGEHSTSSAFLTLVEARPELGWSCAGKHKEELPKESGPIEEVICAASPASNTFKSAELWAEQRGIRFRYLPDMGPDYAGQMNMSTLEGIPIFSQRKEPLLLWSNVLLKRLFDIVFALLAIVLLLSWIFPLSALLLLISGISPLFIQERVGLSGKPFKVVKFRTMKPSSGTSNALQRWMRKMGWDELPQLWNVLMGHMSLVGPRPHTVEDVDVYSALVKNYRIRHWAKPGMTGLAQSRGLRGGGPGADEALLKERIRADVYYIENWSLLLDIRVILETLVRTIFYPSSLHKKSV